jgi:uncharacterized damage-inducible protein DinB
MTSEILRHHLAYTKWATNQVLRAVEEIPPGHLTHDFQTSDRTIIGTLAHTFAGDRIWLQRVKGGAPIPFISDEDRQLSTLQRDWPTVLEGWAAVLDDPARDVSYHDLKGNPYSTPLWQIVLHVVNHGTHHRGQVSGFLRALGHMPPQLDLILYYRRGAGA